MKTKMILQVSSAFLALFMLAGCSLLPKEDEYQISPVVVENEKIEYKTTKVQAGNIAKTETVMCTYKPVKTSSYSFDITGEPYDTVYFSAGEYVEKGQLLAQLDISSITAQLNSCYHSINSVNLKIKHLRQTRDMQYEHQLALLESASSEEKVTLKSAQEIYDSYAVSLSELSNELTVLQMKYSELSKQKSDRQIYAQFSGNVTSALVRSSMDKSVQGETVITVADTSTSMFTANTAFYSYFNFGDTYSMTINSELCTVKVVDPTQYGFEASEPTSDGKAVVYFEMEDAVSSLDENGSGTIELVLEKSENSMYVLSEAIINTASGSGVYYVDENGIMKMKHVKTGIKSGIYTEILDGVKVGEELIIS